MRKLRYGVAATLASVGLAIGAMSVPSSADVQPQITHLAMIPMNGHGNAGTDATWASSNWSGYAETGNFTSVSGSWTVPTVTAGASTGGFRHPTTSWFSASWLGIDGFNNSSLIQTGTEQDFYSGSAHYNAWWEILPAAETPISYPVNPGDVMTATITETSQVVSSGGGRHSRSSGTEHVWNITIGDTTAGWSFTTNQGYSGSGSSAEWVVEAPQVGGQIASLANYSFPTASAAPGDFNNAEVASSIGGGLTGAGLNYANDEGVMIQNNAQVSTPGPQGPSAETFNANYGSSGPAAPTS